MDFSHNFRRASSNVVVFSDYFLYVWDGLALWGVAALSLEPVVVLLGVSVVGGADFVFEFVYSLRNCFV
jgi:hypothetical protein